MSNRHDNTPRPLAYQGQSYASQGELRRRTGMSFRRIQALIASGAIVRLPPEQAPAATHRIIAGSGPAAARQRIFRAADEIASVATLAADSPERRGLPIALRLRRLGLLKAQWHYLQRYGVGVSDGSS